jgi:hypothetical protein
MPIPADDLKSYDDFVTEVALSLGSINKSLPKGELLWHYTNGNALLSILASHTLFATQIACLNDSDEIMYASRQVRDSVSKMRFRCTDSEWAFLSYFASDPTYSTPLPYFVSCFTTNVGGSMWMRSCAACKRVLSKTRLCDHVRCECGWEW